MVIGIDASRATAERRTGTEAYAWHLIRALVPLANERGHTVKLYFNQAPNLPISPSPHLPISLPSRRLWTHLRLGLELLLHPPDVFFTPAHVIPLSHFGPSVATIHDLGYHYFPEAHTKSRVRELIWSTRHNARRSRIVIADSEATERDVSRFYATSRDVISTVYPGYDESLKPVTAAGTLQQVSGKNEISAPYLLFIGTLQPRKNIMRILDAFLQIAGDIPHQLVMAGSSGWLAQPFMDKIAALSPELRQRIRLPGFVDESDKAALISGADALIFPSLYEGFGFPILEAQACGTAVLTADNSSMPEVAGEGALIVSAESTRSIANGMKQLATDAALRDALIAKGFENLQRFSWKTAAEQVLDVLERAARRGASQ